MIMLYSGMTCPFSHSTRIVLQEKGCEFEITDVDMYQPIDVKVSALSPYGEVPILQDRDLVLFNARVINEYLDGITLQDLLDQQRAHYANDYMI